MTAARPIEWVFFDMDGTLCDFDQAMTSGLHAVNDLIERTVSRAADLPTPAEYQEAWEELANRRLADDMSFEEIRRHSIRDMLATRGIRLSASDERDVLDVFLKVRFERTVIFSDVRDVLRALRPRYRLGVISNGNSYAELIGLGGCFDAEFYGQRIGNRKPDPRMFHHVAESLKLDPAACLMVGDSIRDDVDAAVAAGWRAIHLDRRGMGSGADIVVRELADLVRCLGTTETW